MNKKYLTLALLLTLLAVVLVSGCVKEETNGGGEEPGADECPSSCDDNDACTTDLCSEETDYECRHNPITPCCGNDLCEVGEDLQNCVEDCSKGCTNSEQCDDGDRCTTDSCVDGVCKNVVEADCEIVEQEEAHIAKVHFTEPEWVQINGKNWDISGWSIVNNQDEVYITFGDKTKVNGYLKVFSEPGISTDTEKYMNKPNFWSDAGDRAILKNSAGTVISEKTG